MPSSPIPYKFAVIVEDSPDPHGTHEPAMLPGGFIVFSEHLILAAQDEAEFAGMLAHAMAHAAGRHMTRMLTAREISQGKAYAGPDAWAETMKTQTPDGMRQFAREFEGAADLIATRAIAAASLDPSAFAAYIGRTQIEEPWRHQRVEFIERAIGLLPARPYSSSGEFLLIQKELR